MTSMKMIQVIVHHMKMSPTAEPAYGLSKEKEYSMTIKYAYV